MKDINYYVRSNLWKYPIGVDLDRKFYSSQQISRSFKLLERNVVIFFANSHMCVDNKILLILFFGEKKILPRVILIK